MDEKDLCKKRLLDLSRQANRKGIVLFSDFLNLSEQNIYRQCLNQFETKTETFGGVPYAERQIVAFIPDALSYVSWSVAESAAGTVSTPQRGANEEPHSGSLIARYPITALTIKPSNPKFADKLEHRDILGAVMQLGVDRSKIGDILINEEDYYLLCEEGMAAYFMEHVTQIRHTTVTLHEVPTDGLFVNQNLTEKTGIVTSNRLDAVLACVYNLSRSQAQSLIRAEKAFVNGGSMQNSSSQLREGDVISVRGYGRFIFDCEYGETNKGRLKIKYKLYK